MIEVCLKNVRFSLNSYRFWFEHVLKKLIVEVLQMHCSEFTCFHPFSEDLILQTLSLPDQIIILVIMLV